MTFVLFKLWHLRAGYPASNLKRFFYAGCHQDIVLFECLSVQTHVPYSHCTRVDENVPSGEGT